MWIPAAELTDRKESYQEMRERKRRSVLDFDPEKARKFLKILSGELNEAVIMTADNNKERELLERANGDLIDQARNNIEMYDD